MYRSGGALSRRRFRVISDVVYNHTAEGNELGPMLLFSELPFKIAGTDLLVTVPRVGEYEVLAVTKAV
jgi:hypothetical protein